MSEHRLSPGAALAAGVAAPPARATHVRPFRAGDEHGILALLDEVFGGDDNSYVPRSLAMWTWMYRDNPLGTHVVVAVDADGRIVGHYAGVPLRWNANGQQVVVSQGVDTVVHPRCRTGLRRASTFLTTAHAWFATWGNAARCHCSFGFPNRRALRVGRTLLGYEPLFAPVPTLFRNLHRGERRPRVTSGDAGGLRVVPVRAFGAGADALWAAQRPHYPFAAVRDAQYLNWRYAASPIGYRLLEVRERAGDRLRGVAALQCSWTRQPILAIAEYFSAPGDAACLRAVVDHAEEVARQTAQVRVEMWLPARSPLFAAALAAGLQTEPSLLTFCVRLYRGPHDLGWHRRHWYYTIGDSDIA